MSWIEVKAVLDAPPADWSLLIEIFERHGCENTLQTDTPPTLSSAVVSVDGSQRVVEQLSDDLVQAGARVEVRDLVEENWDEVWKQFFKPRRIGNRFVVRPTWESFEAHPGDLEIVLDPGQAFGTGDHPTTRMCLELLEKYVSSATSVADIGCGSGILSVGARKLGSSRVVAIDIDPLSVEVAKENAELNQVEFEAICGAGVHALPSSKHPTPDSAEYDVVVSNIISATLISIARDIAQVVRSGGIWIVSGVIHANWADVQDAALKAGFTLVEMQDEADWVAAAFRRGTA